MKSIQVHRVNFFRPKPQSIRCLSYDSDSCNLAVSRSDSSIEIWDKSGNLFLQKVIPGSLSASVECLAWCRSRLFSAGLNGYLTEHNLTTLLPKYRLVITSGCPVWCMASDHQQKHLAMGNEDGHVVLYELSLEALDFVRKFDRQEGGILCLSWHSDDKLLATGSVDAIRLWDTETGHVLSRIVLGRKARNNPTLVWSIAFLSNHTIVSGDSCGNLSIWDAKIGTLIDTVVNRNEDILSVAVNQSEDTIYASGVDPTISVFMKSQNDGKWIRSIQRNVHSHDVRALTLVSDYLASGGDDCNLILSKYPPKTVVRFFPFCQKSYSALSSSSSEILLQYPHYVELWSIKEKSPLHLARIKPTKNESVICSSLSPNGSMLAYSTLDKIRLFLIQTSLKINEVPSLYKIALPQGLPTMAKVLLFNSDSTKLFIYCDEKIYIVRCDSSTALIETSIEENADFNQIYTMQVSPNNAYLACACHNRTIAILDLKSYKIHCKLPVYKCKPTTMKFNPSSENLLVAYSDRTVVEYRVKKKKYTQWTTQLKQTDFQSESNLPITSIAFCSQTLYMADENALYVFPSGESVSPEKKKLKESPDSTVARENVTYRTVSKYEHISSIHSLSEDQLVIVQISSNQILESLPPPVYKKKFGT